MCGRYVTPEERAIEQFWNLRRHDPFKGIQGDARITRPNYNTLPTQMVPVERIGKQGPEVVRMRWGMDRVLSGGKVSPTKLNNARMENVRKYKPFAKPFENGQRGLQLAQGYYEWKEKSKADWSVRIPHYIHPTDQVPIFAFACVYDYGVEDQTLLTCSVITMQATGRLAGIDERMPAILRREDFETWLTGTPEEAYAVLKPYPDELLHISRVRPDINKGTTPSSPSLIEPDPNPEPQPPSDEEIAAEEKRKKEEKEVKKAATAAKREAEKEEKKRVKEAEKEAAREAKRKAEKDRGQGELF